MGVFGRRVAVVALVAVAALLSTLAMRVETWRTGDQGLAPMTFVRESVELTGRLWIDTDAACGNSARTDPDDWGISRARARSTWPGSTERGSEISSASTSGRAAFSYRRLAETRR
jgi:hypothetical protein